MPLTFIPPKAVQAVAKAALNTYQEASREDVYGVGLAQKISEGALELSEVLRMHRYFITNQELVEREQYNMQRTPADGGEVLSWALLGGDSGAVWAQQVYEAAVKAGDAPADPYDVLMGVGPTEVYDLFAFEAWRYEFGFTPATAAKFVESYTRSTGNLIDLPAAFGGAAVAVGNAIYRRTATPDPLKIAMAKMLDESDPASRLAAFRDLEDMGVPQMLTEGQAWLKIKGMPALSAAKIIWAPFVAHFVLAAENPEALKPINNLSLLPPKPDATSIGAPSQYNDAINLYLMYFHPKGVHYHDPSGDPKFSGLTEEVYALLVKAHYGQNITPIMARKVLGKARRWTAQHKLAGSLFHLFNADWAKADWADILTHVPVDADVYVAFAAFVDANPLPKDGVKLQQTISATETIKDVAKAWEKKNPGSILTPASMAQLPSVKYAAQKGTPFGVWSKLAFELSGEDIVHHGYFVDEKGEGVHALKKSGSIYFVTEAGMYTYLTGTNGALNVTQGHYAKPGTAYALPVTTAPADSHAVSTPDAPSAPADNNTVSIPDMPSAPADSNPVLIPDVSPDAVIMAHLKDSYEEEHLAAFKALDPDLTMTMAKARGLIPGGAPVGAYRFTTKAFTATLVAAFHVQTTLTAEDGTVTDVDDVVILFKDFQDGDIISESDNEVVQAISAGKIAVTIDGQKIKPPAAEVLAVGMWVQVDNSINLKYNLADTRNDAWHYVVALKGKYAIVLPRRLRPHGVTTLMDVLRTSITKTAPVTTPVEWADNMSGFKFPEAAYIPHTPKLPLGSKIDMVSMFAIVIGGFVLADAPEQPRIVGMAPLDSNAVGGESGMRYMHASMVVPVVETPIADQEQIPAPGFAPAPYKSDSVPWATHEAAVTMIASGVEMKSYEDVEAPGFRVGTKYTHANGESATVVGLCMQNGVTKVLSMEHVGNQLYFWKPAQIGKVATEPNEEIIAQLKPYGGVGCVEGVDYVIPGAALKAAATKGVLFTKAPPLPPYFAGTVFDGVEGALIGWSGESPVMWDNTNLSLVSMEALDTLTQASATPGSIDEEEGVVFARTGPAIHIHSDGVAFNSQLYVPMTTDPEIPYGPAILTGKARRGAGTVVVLPPGAVLSGAKAQFSFANPSVVLTYPVGGFSSKLTFPKGGVDSGEDQRAAARRETWEETGLIVRLKDYLGDYTRTTSIARMYMAEFRGGSPYKAGAETDAVAVRPLKSFNLLHATASAPGADASKWPDAVLMAYVQGLPWAKPLSLIDKRILADAVRWLLVNGMPSYAEAPPGPVVSAYVTSLGIPLIAYTPTQTGEKDVHYSVQGEAVLDALGYPASSLDTSIKTYVDQGLPLPGTTVFIKTGKPPTTKTGLLLGYGAVADPDSFATVAVVAIAGQAVHVPLTGDTEITVLPVATITPTPAAPYSTESYAAAQAALQALLYAAPQPVPWNALGNDVNAIVDKIQGAGVAGKGALSWTPSETIQGHAYRYGSMARVKGGKDYIFLGAVARGLVSCAWLFADAVTGKIVNLHPAPDLIPLPHVVDDMLHYTPDQFAVLVEVAKWVDDSGPKNVTLQAARKVLYDLGVTYALSLPAHKLAFAAHLKLKSHHPMLDTLLEKVALEKFHKPKGQTSGPAVQVHPTGLPQSTVPIPEPVIAVKLPDSGDAGWATIVRITALVTLTGSTLIDTDTSLAGGSKPNKVLSGPDGAHYVFKPSVETNGHWRVGAEVAGYTITQELRPNQTPAVRAITFGGKVGSLQPRVMGAKTLNQGDYDTLSDLDKGTVLAQHAIDMFLGDHDGGVANWLRAPDGQLVVIDKGQTFRFAVAGTPESLDPGTTPQGVVGKAIAKRLLSDWAASSREIPKSAFVKFARSILKVLALSDTVLDQALQAWEYAVGAPAKAVKPTLRALLVARRDGYVKEWTKVMVKLAKARGETWNWPIPMQGAPEKTQPAQIDPETAPAEDVLGFTEEEEAYIETARTSGWQGKSIQVDGDAIENQEVLVKSIDYKVGGKVVEGTLITFRITAQAAQAIASKFDSIAKVVTATTGAQRLPLDAFYEPILAAAKTINHHLMDKKDTDFNAGKIESFKATVLKLQEIVGFTQGGVGKYQGTPVTVVNAMATKYLSYVATLESVLASPAQFVGTKVEVFSEFLWEAKVEEEDDIDDLLKDLTIVKTSSAYVPVTTTAGTRVQAVDQTVVPEVGVTPQYQITLKSYPGVKIYLTDVGNLSYAGSRAHFGVAWALLPEAPSVSSVARMLRVFEKATDIRMNPATKEDREYLFLRQQLYVSTPARINVSSTTLQQVNAPEDVTSADAAYQLGDKKTALAKLRPLLATRLGVTTSEMIKDPRYNAAPKYTRGAGRFRTVRMDHTRASLVKLLGNKVYLGHSSTGGTMLGLFQKVLPHNGALLANVDRAFMGVPTSDVSLQSDINKGGAVGVFMGMRRLGMAMANHFYFDISLLLRVDVMQVGTGDDYGNWASDRFTDPNTWVSTGHNQRTGSITPSEQGQFVARHDVDWREYLKVAAFSTAAERQAAVDLCHQLGITAFAGVPVEKVLVVS